MTTPLALLGKKTCHRKANTLRTTRYNRNLVVHQTHLRNSSGTSRLSQFFTLHTVPIPKRGRGVVIA